MVSSTSNSALPPVLRHTSSSPEVVVAEAESLMSSISPTTTRSSSREELLDLMKEQSHQSTLALNAINQQYREKIQQIKEDFNAQIKAMEEKVVAEKLVALESHHPHTTDHPSSSVKQEEESEKLMVPCIFSLLRTGQGREESGSEYFNKMVSMYHQLPASLCVNELFLVSLIISRLNPFYAEHLYLRAEEYHLDRLESMLLSIDDQQYIARSSRPPPYTSGMNNTLPPSSHAMASGGDMHVSQLPISLPTLSTSSSSSNSSRPISLASMESLPRHPHHHRANHHAHHDYHQRHSHPNASQQYQNGPGNNVHLFPQIPRANEISMQSSSSTTFPTKKRSASEL